MGGGAETVQRAFAAMAAGDMETLTALLDEQLVFELGGRSRFAGRHEGRDRLFELQAELAAALDLQNEVVAVHDIEGGAIVHQRGRGRDGYADEALLVFTVEAGRVTRVREFLFDHGPLEDRAPA